MNTCIRYYCLSYKCAYFIFSRYCNLSSILFKLYISPLCVYRFHRNSEYIRKHAFTMLTGVVARKDKNVLKKRKEDVNAMM